MKNEVISVIVPVYNVEQYLKECVESILQQTYQELEILLIDDGSTDQSGKMCDDFAKQDDRIRVFHKENGGAASAKNFGLAHITGSYVMIVDSDDKIEARLVETLYRSLKEQDAEIALGDYYLYNQNENMFYLYVFDKDYKVEVIDSQMAIDRQLDHALNTATYIVPWCKLYKADLFEHVRFPEGYKFDDEYTVHRLYL